MKKLVILFLLFPCLSVMSNEITEDYFDIASNYATYGQYKEAGEYLDKILGIEPANSDAFELKKIIFRVTNPNTKSYLSTNNKTVSSAVSFKNKGDKDKMISALSSNQNDFWSCYLLANFYLEEKNFPDAIKFYEKSITLQPNFSQSYLGLGQSFLGNGDFQNAITNFNKYLSYNKISDLAYALRGLAYMNAGDITQAENDIKQALKIDENFSYLLIQAKILYNKGDYNTAKEKFSVLSKNIQTSEVYKYMGLCDYALGDYTNALLNLDKAIILSDEDKSLDAKYNEIKSKLEK